MNKPPILRTLTLIAFTFPTLGNAILGTDVKNDASTSTCLIIKPNGDDTCNGVLISPTEVQTASHCFTYLWHDGESESPKVVCGFKDGTGFQFESRIEKQTLVSKSTNFDRNRFSDDQMILTLKTPAPRKFIASTAEVSARSIFTVRLSNGQSALDPNYNCKTEAFLGPSKTSAYEAIVPRESLSYDPVTQSISLKYAPIEITAADQLDTLRDAIEDGKLNSYSSVYNLVKTFRTPVLTHQGDSGSPLYCYETANEANTKFVAGILSRGLNEVQTHSAQHKTLSLGSKWNVPIGKDQMDSRKIGKKSIMQKRALNESSEIEFSAF